MEILFSVENFEEGGGKYREINSPRTLEACLRTGLDPAELYPKERKVFESQRLTDQMLDIKYSAFERKRQDKIAAVRHERNSILQYAERKWQQMAATSPEATGERPMSPGQLAERAKQAEMEASRTMIEQEEKRIEALRKRQEKEMNKIVEREQTLATLQLKIKRAEEEEIKKKKAHDKKVAEERLAAEKKKQARVLELKRLEEEEAEKKREIARKDAALADKLQKKRLLMERQMKREAIQRDEERKQKVEESRKKTEALLKLQEDQAEANRLKMLEREERIMAQLEHKKELKREEVARQRAVAAVRIAEAMEKFHSLHEAKKTEFARRQAEAAVRAKENEVLERERLKKQAEAREKRNKQRLNRLIDAYKSRAEHRKSILDRRKMKDQVYGVVKAERDEQIALMKFTSDLKLRDKLDNVERVARVNEFKRLQTLKHIESMDSRYEEIQSHKADLLNKHAEEAKQSLVRKHEISDMMDKMRMTNDFTLLDKLFAKQKGGKKGGTAGGTAGGMKGGLGDTKGLDDGDGGEDARLNQTI
mmetsp:Transcript_1921/g.3066  ORF Transcript_1921/g.3066 Transcript_1921/m.3066 type:complete len:537 (+) Transcript_1921:179-1789(+)